MTITYSDIITNKRAGIKNSAKNDGGEIQVVKSHIAVGTADIDDTDIIHLCNIPMQASIVSIKLYNDDLDSNGTPTLVTDLGLYYGGNNGLTVSEGDVIDIDAYGTDLITLQAANVAGVELAYEIRNISAHGNEIWQDGGLSANPGGTAYISLTIDNVAATAVAGDILLVVEYVIS